MSIVEGVISPLFRPIELEEKALVRRKIDITTSTQDEARANEKSLTPDTCILYTAEEQTKGRGAHGSWLSPRGVNIYATFAFLFPKRSDLFQLPQIVSFSILKVLRSRGFRTEMKWINDLLIGGKKVGGVLVESTSFDEHNFAVYVGVGLNINMDEDFCNSLDQPATSLRVESGQEEDREDILLDIYLSLSKNLALFSKEGFSPFYEMIQSVLAFRDSEIIFMEDSGKIIKAVYRGINEDGLLLLDVNGTVQKFFSGKILKKREFEVLRLDSIPSTQDYLREKIALLAANKWVVAVAEEQTKGSGTHDRRWISPPKVNVYATFGFVVPSSLRIEKVEDVPIFTQIVSLSVVQTLASFGFNAGIKWRNDVLIDGKKISGILCELVPLKGGRYGALIGIGLNVNMPQEICLQVTQSVTSMAVEKAHEFDKEAVFLKLKSVLEENISLCLEKGFESFSSTVRSHLLLIGKEITFETEDKKVLKGRFEGIDERGCLILSSDERTLFVRGSIAKESFT